MPVIEVSDEVYQELLKLQARWGGIPVSNVIDQLVSRYRAAKRLERLEEKVEDTARSMSYLETKIKTVADLLAGLERLAAEEKQKWGLLEWEVHLEQEVWE